jgi:hypothetical protein
MRPSIIRCRTALFSAVLSTFVTPNVLALPSIENISVDPPPSGEWIIGATTGAPGVATVRVRFDAVVSGQNCNGFTTFGWMVGNQCQNFFKPKKVIGNTYGASVSCRNPTPDNPMTTGKIDLSFDVARNANGAPLVLCAEDYSGETAKVAYRVSYGQPVKSVKLSKATYSSQSGVLRVQGDIVPKGNTSLNGSEVQLIDTSGTLLGKGVVSKKKFDIKLPIDSPPLNVKVKIVNTESPIKSVKLIK